MSVNLKDLTKLLERAEKLFNVGNLKKSYEVALQGVGECSKVHKVLLEQTQDWDVRKASDYKYNFKVQGKKLELWMNKFWEVVESTGIEPVIEDYETDMIQYDVYGNIIPSHLRDENKNS